MIDDIAIHEAGHAVVGVSVGLEVVAMTLAPPMARFSQVSVARVSRRANMAVAAAGHLAEERHSGAPTDSAFEHSLVWFFEQLGDEPVTSSKAESLAACTPEDDVRALAYNIDRYAKRPLGWAQFRLARSWAARILADRWDEVEELARIGRSIVDPETQCVVRNSQGRWTVGKVPDALSRGRPPIA